MSPLEDVSEYPIHPVHGGARVAVEQADVLEHGRVHPVHPHGAALDSVERGDYGVQRS